VSHIPGQFDLDRPVGDQSLTGPYGQSHCNDSPVGKGVSFLQTEPSVHLLPGFTSRSITGSSSVAQAQGPLISEFEPRGGGTLVSDQVFSL
jgi:hypothetical protein